MPADVFLPLLALLALALFLGAPVVAVVALMKARALERQVADLRWRLNGLPPEAARPSESPPEPEPESPPESLPESSSAEAADAPPPWLPRLPERPAPTAAPAAAPVAAPREAPKEAPREAFENRLASRWMVWLGGAALALAGLFLVKYSLDQGLLAPAVRVVLGGALGAALMVAGDLALRRLSGPGPVPAALTGGGLAAAFGSVYAAHGLYDLIPAPVAFGLLAVLALAGLTLSLRQGAVIAVLGLLGAFFTPALVGGAAPQPWALFGFLGVAAAAGLALTRYRPWPWLAWGALAGSAFWQALGQTAFLDAHPDMALVLGLHALALIGMVAVARRHAIAAPWPVDAFALAGLAVPAVLSFSLLRWTGYGTEGLLAFFAAMLALPLLARWRAGLTALVPLVLVLVVLALAGWHEPDITQVFTYPWTPAAAVPGFDRFIVAASAVAAVALGLGWWTSRTAPLPAAWAALAGLTPLAVLAVAFARLDGVPNTAWAGLGLGLAFLAGEAARRARDHKAALAAYALAGLGALGLTLTMLLDRSWLTMALALLVPALAWLDARLDLRPLRWAALVLAALVAARLLAPWYLPLWWRGPDVGWAGGWAWILYAHGGPAAAFALAAWFMSRRGDDLPRALVESAAMATGLATAALLIRHFLAPLGAGGHLLEAGLNGLTWGLAGWAQARRAGWAPRLVTRASVPVLLGGWLVAVLAALTEWNPLSTGRPVGDWPVLDALLPAYGLPGLLAAGLAVTAHHRDHKRWATAAAGLSGVLLLVWLCLVLRRLFHGPVLTGPMGDAELYAYSAALMAVALAALVLGLWRGWTDARRAALGLMAGVAAKVFLVDMAGLDGLLRVASFLGLGLALVGIGLLYQRLAGRPQPEDGGGA